MGMKLASPACLGLIYLTSEVLLAFSRRSQPGATSRDENSLRLLWVAITASILAGVWVARNFPEGTLPNRDTFARAGLILFGAGLILRWSAIIHLGRFFTVNVAIAADHDLIETGPYRFVRHPSYTGSLLAFLGFALTFGNWLTVFVMIVPIFFAFIHRMNVEERALTAALGSRYVRYRSRTRRLLPLIY